jgi:SAM-dependent methyltransferase
VGRRFFRGKICFCEKCGHAFLETPPSEEKLIKYYQKIYWLYRSDNINDQLLSNNDYKINYRSKHQIDFVQKHIDISRLNDVLEIGAGPANASQLLRDKSCQNKIKINVFETGKQWEDYYKKYDIEKIADYFPSKTGKKFDYIHTSHWLEHVRNLNNTLEELSNIINNSGFLFVEVPNEEHYYWDLQIEDTPHIQFFSKKSLILVMKKHNFECVDIGEYGISYLDRHNGISSNEENDVKSDKGIHIRALFKKISNA